MKDLIEITDELSSDLAKFKELVREFEVKLNRTTNVIDIIGEIEVSKILGLKMVRDLINPGFDAYDGKREVQIKATRAKGTNSRVSTLLKKADALDFDYVVLIKYIHDSDFEIEGMFKASKASIRNHFNYINSPEKLEARNGKKRHDMAISQFIRYSEFVYEFNKNTFVANHLFKPSTD